MYILWAIWKRRNTGKRRIVALAEALNLSLQLGLHSSVPGLIKPTHWAPPQPDVVKVNFDGACSSTAGIGFAIRGSDGRFIIAGASATSPLLAELYSLGASGCREGGTGECFDSFEGDSMSVVAWPSKIVGI